MYLSIDRTPWVNKQRMVTSCAQATNAPRIRWNILDMIQQFHIFNIVNIDPVFQHHNKPQPVQLHTQNRAAVTISTNFGVLPKMEDSQFSGLSLADNHQQARRKKSSGQRYSQIRFVLM